MGGHTCNSRLRRLLGSFALGLCLLLLLLHGDCTRVHTEHRECARQFGRVVLCEAGGMEFGGALQVLEYQDRQGWMDGGLVLLVHGHGCTRVE